MGKRVISGSLSVSGIESIRKQLEEYKLATLPNLIRQFVDQLANYGILTAKEIVGNEIIGGDDEGGGQALITFRKELNPTQNGCTCIIYATDSAKIIKSWLTKEGIKSAEISPILMAEFGSGQKAIEGHQGTFPGQTHAFDEEGWYWQDLNGGWHHSIGIEPTQPMYNAWLQMATQYKTIAKSVFG